MSKPGPVRAEGLLDRLTVRYGTDEHFSFSRKLPRVSVGSTEDTSRAQRVDDCPRGADSHDPTLHLKNVKQVPGKDGLISRDNELAPRKATSKARCSSLQV